MAPALASVLDGHSVPFMSSRLLLPLAILSAKIEDCASCWQHEASMWPMQPGLYEHAYALWLMQSHETGLDRVMKSAQIKAAFCKVAQSSDYTLGHYTKDIVWWSTTGDSKASESDLVRVFKLWDDFCLQAEYAAIQKAYPAANPPPKPPIGHWMALNLERMGIKVPHGTTHLAYFLDAWVSACSSHDCLVSDALLTAIYEYVHLLLLQSQMPSRQHLAKWVQ